MALSQNTKTVYWTEGGPTQSLSQSSNNPFVAWAIEMETVLAAAGGGKSSKGSGGSGVLVTSISFGATEQSVDGDSMTIFNNAAIMLGIMGSTIGKCQYVCVGHIIYYVFILSRYTNTQLTRSLLTTHFLVVAAGDNGAPGMGLTGTCSAKTCFESTGKDISQWSASSSWSGAGYFPSFPATSPYGEF